MAKPLLIGSPFYLLKTNPTSSMFAFVVTGRFFPH
jgi:hypothetical protein